VRLELIGRHQEALRGEVANLPASAELVSSGPQPPAEVHRRMSEADLLVLPSLFEEWGYVAVEALLLGTPVVTYPVYPFPWMLDGGLGVVAEQQTPESLAFAIERALSGACLPDLAQAALSRFGPEAAGVKLAEAWGLPARAPAKPAVG
jgi:glycosyltransferase involved in cell wall biosynthesis